MVVAPLSVFDAAAKSDVWSFKLDKQGGVDRSPNHRSREGSSSAAPRGCLAASPLLFLRFFALAMSCMVGVWTPSMPRSRGWGGRGVRGRPCDLDLVASCPTKEHRLVHRTHLKHCRASGPYGPGLFGAASRSSHRRPSSSSRGGWHTG